MKLKKLALIAEIVSGVAIVVTLIVLVSGIRDNTSAVRAASRQSIAERVEHITLTVATNRDLLELLAAPDGIELTPVDDLQLRSFLVAILRNSEEAYLQVQEGRLEEEYFDRRIASILRFVSTGVGAELI